jgi:transcriptional regulator with XRE-family HTH domain
VGETPRPVPAAEEFGRRVRARRSALNWSQERLAHEAGIHMTYVSSVERGMRNISLTNILKLCDALETDPGELMQGLSAK